MAEDDILHVTLQKRDKGQTWPSPIQGQGQLDPMAADIEQKRLMLQRFQEEVSLVCLCCTLILLKCLIQLLLYRTSLCNSIARVLL